MYRPIETKEIIGRIEHIRALLRQIVPQSVEESILHEKREQRLKDLISNLRRTNGQAMVQTLYDLEELCYLTRDATYQLFGYSLDALREYDLFLNQGRTHILESYVYERDFPIELPLHFTDAAAFNEHRWLDEIVLSWQTDLPIHVLGRSSWHQRGTFYVQVGTEDSLGSELPAGSIALVDQVTETEKRAPNPCSIYLLQFRNGYRCSRCVATRGRLHLILKGESYSDPQEFPYPGPIVRIVGRIRSFTLSLPLEAPRYQRGLWSYKGNAPLILPWEHLERWQLFATKYRRFVRTEMEQRAVEQMLQERLHTKISERTRQRYRSATPSDTHGNVLMQMTVEYFARFSDTMRLGGYRLHDIGRFSLATMLKSNDLSALLSLREQMIEPTPAEVWDQRRQEVGEYAALLAMKFPQPQQIAKKVLRLGMELGVSKMTPVLARGSWLLAEEMAMLPNLHSEKAKTGWERPLYAMRDGLKTVIGYLDREGSDLVLLAEEGASDVVGRIRLSEFHRLLQIRGAVVPV